MPPRGAAPGVVILPAGIEYGPKPYSEVYGWGKCSDGQLGLGAAAMAEGSMQSPTPIEDLNHLHIKTIAAGPEHTLAVSTNSEVYSCGSSNFGKLGHKQAEMDIMDDAFEGSCCHSFREIGVLKEEFRANKEGNVVDLVCGPEYSLALVQGGHAYTWGCGAEGKLGHQDHNNKKIPTKISALLEKKVPVGKAACGSNHCLLTTASAEYGEVGKEFGVTISGGLPMAIGGNEAGQLGLDDANGRGQWTPQMLDKKLRSNIEGSVDAKAGSGLFDGCSVTDLACGQMFSLALAGGKVWSWGSGDAGQLGLQKPPDDPKRPKFIPMRFHVYVPTHIEELRSVRQIAAGSYFSMAVCDNGKAYTWGKNEIGQLGHGDSTEREKPTEVTALSSVKMVAAGDRHALALVEGGKVFAWGSGRDGQLGLGDGGKKNTPQEIPDLEDMQCIAASGNTSFAWRTLHAKGPEKKRKAEAPKAEEEAPPPAKKAKKGAAKKKKK